MSRAPAPTWCRLVAPALLIGSFLALALPRLSQIAGQDEILHYVGLGQRLYEGGFREPDRLITFSPHLYGWLIWASHQACGPGILAARVPGLLAWGVALALAWWWLSRPAAGIGLPVRVVTTALLAVMPLALQAAAIVDIDNTILVPAVLALTVGVAHATERTDGLRLGMVAGLLALALWCRLTTPTILLPVLLGYTWGRRRCLSPVVAMAAAFGLGWLAFLGTWWLYCHRTGVSFGGPFRYLAESFGDCVAGQNRGIRADKVALTLVYTALWVGPWLAVLWAWVTLSRIRQLWRTRQVAPVDVSLLAGLAVLGGYSVVGGALFGFPKYHSPAVPLLLAATAVSLAAVPMPVGRRAWLAWLGLALCGAALQAMVVGDPLRVLRLDLREATFQGQPAVPVLWRGVVLPLAIAGGLSAVLLAASWRLRLVALPWGIVALALGTNLAFVGTQQSAGYQTGYNYGDQGDAGAAAAFLAAALPPDRAAIVPGEIVYLLARPAVAPVPNELWLDEDALRRELARPEVAAAAISLLTNTMAQVETLTRVAADLPDYERTEIGRYVVFLRRSAN